MQNKQIVIASDSFKETLSSIDICKLFKEKLDNKEDISPIFLPIADGGEGSLEALSYVISGGFVEVEVKDLYFNKIKARYFIDRHDNAYIETTSSAGVALAKEDNNPGLVTTFGLGQQILHAIDLGCRNIFVFLGGSATNDGGVGLASALGVRFYNENNELFVPTGLTLKNIVKIDNSIALNLLEDVNLTALSDVSSPLYGLKGAAYKYASQKGATLEEVKELDEGLKHLSDIIKRDLNKDISTIDGAGAAGGLGGGLVGLLNASIQSGINTLLDLIHFDDLIKTADYVISGEGKLDKQTLDGKVIDGIAFRCEKYDKPLLLIVGESELSLSDIKQKYPCVSAIYETNSGHLPFEEIKENARNDYLAKVDELLNNLD